MKYIGTKEVEATPMTAEEAAKKGYRVSNNAKEDGYEVTYKDGYKSWSPKEVFDEAYRCSETYIDRLNIEYDDLEKKCAKLGRFYNSDKFLKLSNRDKNLLREQYKTMVHYSSVICERIRNSAQQIAV